MYKSKRSTLSASNDNYSFGECHCSEDFCLCFDEDDWVDATEWHYQSKLANELDSFYPVGKKRIVHRIFGLAPRNSYLYSGCDDKDLLPLWKLTLKTGKLIELHLELAVPNCINKSDIININCAILGKQYTKCTCNYITNFDNSPCTTRRKMNKLTFDFEFRFDDTCYYEQNINNVNNIKSEYELIENTYKSLADYFVDHDGYGMEQREDSKWIKYLKYNHKHNNHNKKKSDQIRFTLTFEFDILRFKGDLDDEVDNINSDGKSHRDYNNNSLRWFDFHFGDFNKLLDEIVMKQNQDDEYLYLLFEGQYKKCDHQWFLNRQTLYNIICLKKIVYDKYRNNGALSKYAYGSPYYFNHDHCDDVAHCGDDNNSARACDQESTTGIGGEIHCQHTGQHAHTGQDNPSDMYFVYQRHMDDYDDDHVTTKVEIKNYHGKRRYYRFNHSKTECKQTGKKNKIKAKRKKEKKNKTQFELDKWMNGF